MDNQKKRRDSTSSTKDNGTASSTKRTGGVADYFTILGVGDELIWKHSQKQREQQMMLEQQEEEPQPQQPEAGDFNQEDQAALMERFYREIIDVTILTHKERNVVVHQPPCHGAPSSVAPASTIMLTSSPSIDTDVNTVDGSNSMASSRIRSTSGHQGSQQPSILPSPSSHSEATTVATTILSTSEATYKHNNSPPPTEIDGFTLLSKTYPPEKNPQGNSPHPGWGQGGGSHQQQNPSVPNIGNALSSSFSQGMDTSAMQSSFPWNQPSQNTRQPHGGDAKDTDSYIFDANLDPSGGLRDQVCSTVLQWEESMSDHHASSGASVGGSSAASLKGIRRKVESSWKRWNQNQSKQSRGHSNHHMASNGPNHSSVKFYLGYKRRTPDQDHVPAVADLKLYYVQIPREATTRPPSQHSNLLDHHNPSTTPGSSAGLAGRVAAAAGHVLFRSHIDVEAASSQNGTFTLESHHQREDFQRVDLEEVVPLPEGFDRWSIPEAFKVVYVPKVQPHDPPLLPSKSAALREKTVLMASPSHGVQRRREKQQSTDLQDENAQHLGAASMNSTTDEAVEAYVEGSFSAPNSPVPPVDNSPKKKKDSDDDKPSSPQTFVPKLFSDVPFEEDNGEAQQHHHPFYHAEDKWLYVPVVAVRHQKTSEEERYHEDPGIIDLAVSFCDKAGMSVLPQEQDDYDIMMDNDEEEFSLVSKTSWLVAREGDNSSLLSAEQEGEMVGTGMLKKRKDSAIKAVKKSLGSPTILVKRNCPIGFADVAFATRVLDRFPLKNYKGLPLPEEELPMFCYPTGCRLYRAPFSDAPLPEYYGFVVKNERGDSIYVSCVSFMEPLTRKKVDQLSAMSEKRRRTCLAHRRFCERMERRKRRKQGNLYCSDDAEPIDPSGSFGHAHLDDEDEDEEDSDDNCILTSFDSMTTFENKTICLVSRYPFWTAFRRFLSHLHILSGSSSELPLERCLSHLLLTVPVPKPGGPNVIVPLPALNQPMIMSLPPLKDFPLIDLPFQRLVACLDVSTIVTIVLGLLALERKVIVMSSRPSLVLDACELLRSLLFPFELCAPYVPRLTEPFMSCLEFPGAIFVGIHDDGCPDGLAATVRKSPPEDSIFVDLDTGSMDCSGNRFEVLTGAWQVMPAGARSVLVSELETLCRDADIVPGQEPLDSLVDSAFDATLPSGLVEDFDLMPEHHESREPLDDRAIRDAFLRFFCYVLRGYERFLVVPDADFLISGNEWFDTQAFLSSAPKDNVAYLNSLVSTQLFQSFIQRRTEDSDVHCLMFDECLTEYHSSPVPYGRLGGDVETIPSPDHSQPQMLYSLLVDQSAAAPYSGLTPGKPTNSNLVHDHSNLSVDRSSVDGSHYDGGSEVDSGSYPSAKPSLSTATDLSDGRIGSRADASDIASLKNSESVVTSTGDIITAPPRAGLPVGVQFIYCVDGNPCFPHRLNKSLFLPREPDSWLVEMSKTAPSPSLARSEREIDEANRRKKSATSFRGFHTQKRCLWQLPKLMGSHFLGSWLLCIPSQVSQADLSPDQQSRYLLRALGALRLLRHKQKIIPDEAAYRALMVACGRTKSDRRVELVKLFGLLRSDGIFPSAVTLGQYTRALAEGYSKRAASEVPESDGVEVSESMSMVRGSGRRNSISGMARSIDSALFALDGNLADLESAGRRWQQRAGFERAGIASKASNLNSPKLPPTDRKSVAAVDHRRRHRSWLPVVVSSSFVPSASSASSMNQEGSLLLQSSDVSLVALWSRTCACDSCGYIPLEEEVQAGWDSVGGEHDVLGAVSCPRCGYTIIPMLGYRCLSIEEALELKESPQNINDADFAGLPPQVGPYIDPGKNKASFVTYISPATLRCSLEGYIDEMGEEVLSRERLKELDPEVFYNLFWYCARFNVPLPLPINRDGDSPPKHLIAFAAWERTAAERGCHSGAKALSGLLSPQNQAFDGNGESSGDVGATAPFDEFPLLGRYNLQGFHTSVWDHPDLSEILVSLVTVCDSDRRDFKVVVECVLRCNRRRREEFGIGDSGSDVGCPVDVQAASDGALSPSVELDCYKTILYLAKYQCTTAFHTFFPAVAKPCKGSHFWCAIGTPLPIFDRLLREAVKKVNSKDNSSYAPIPDVSDVALGFRCVFGHLI